MMNTKFTTPQSLPGNRNREHPRRIGESAQRLVGDSLLVVAGRRREDMSAVFALIPLAGVDRVTPHGDDEFGV
jgi:hypothetical protein